ncbi:MAG: Lrp/AsnC family transcriptional regulator [Promethearchaeota archaeon]
MSEDDKSNKDVIAFLLMTTDSDRTEEILDRLKGMAEVIEAYIIYGDWDMIVKVKIPSLPELTRVVMNLRKIMGVRKTSTLITLQE